MTKERIELEEAISQMDAERQELIAQIVQSTAEQIADVLIEQEGGLTQANAEVLRLEVVIDRVHATAREAMSKP